jgi:hypothetical protein
MSKVPDFKIRSSATGSIMAGSVGASQSQLENIAKMDARVNPMTKPMLEKYNKDKYARDNPELPAGAKTYCCTWLKEQLYDRRKGFSSKYTDKGNICEDNSIAFLNEYFLADMKKNEEFFSNDFMQGTPDILPTGEVWDVKNSWEPNTFPLFDTKPDKGYWWQLQSYMALTGRKKARLIYTLMDAPAELITDEARRASYKSDATSSELLEYYTAQMTYSDIDTDLRIKWFDFDRDDKAIEQIKERVALCQEYINKLIGDI